MKGMCVCVVGVRGVQPIPPTRLNPTRRVKSVFRTSWVGLGYKIFFDSGLGWVWVIKLQTQSNPPIYLKYII